MPPRFQLLGSDLYLPVPWKTGQLLDEDEPNYFFANGILRPGVTREAAIPGLNVTLNQLVRLNPYDFPDHAVAYVRDWSDALYTTYKKMFFLLAAAVGLLLIISCGNAAGLLLVHASARQKEMAVRTALGAGKHRLMRQFLAESVVLATVGCLMGCLLSYVALNVIPKQWTFAGVLCGEADVHLSWLTLLVAMCVSFVATIAAGIAPAVVLLRGNLQKQLGSHGVGVNATFRGGGFRSALVVCQVALSVVLLVAAGLVMRTFIAMMHVNYGIQSTNLLYAWAQFPKGRYKSPEERVQYVDQLMRQFQTIPGVVSAAESFNMPLYGGARSDITIVGKPHQGRWTSMIDGCSVDYFKTLGLQLLRGRLISQDDIAARHNVTVINQAMARKYFGTEDPIGHQIKISRLDQDPHAVHNVAFSIVGVVSDFANEGIERPPAPEAIFPHSFVPFGGFGILVRTAIDPNLLLNSMRRVMWNLDPEIALNEPITLDPFLDQQTYSKPRFGVISFAVCAGVGLLLSLIGIFTITAYTVSLMSPRNRHPHGPRRAARPRA